MATKIYMSTDAGAPVLTNESGRFIQVLDSCLINGYGDKTPPGGWTKPFAGVDQAVYRNDAVNGSGRYLEVNDVRTGLVAGVCGYDHSAGFGQGENPFPVAGGYIRVSSNSGAVPCKWILIADSQFFYFFRANAHATDSVFSEGARGELFFGDLVDPEYPFEISFMGCIDVNNLDQTGGTYTIFSTGQVGGVARAGARVCVPAVTGLWPESNQNVTYGSHGAASLSSLVFRTTPEPNGVENRLYPVEAYFGSVRMAVMPGLYAPTVTSTTDAEIVLIDGKDYLRMPGSTSLGASRCVYILLDDWR